MNTEVTTLLNLKQTIDTDIIKLQQKLYNLREESEKITKKLRVVCPHNDVNYDTVFDGHTNYRYKFCNTCKNEFQM